MALGLRLFTERTGEGAGTPTLDSQNEEELVHTQPGVSIVLGSLPPISPGTLYISTKKVVWLSDIDREKGFAVDFVSLSLHAVSRDPEAYPSPCIYTQVETGTDEDESEDTDSESNDALDLSKVAEMRLVPSDPNQLDTLFHIFCECAELNPEAGQEDEEENTWFFGGDQMEGHAEDGEDPELDFPLMPTNTIGYSNGHHDLARTVLELEINDQRFEDAEEMDEDNQGSHQ